MIRTNTPYGDAAVTISPLAEQSRARRKAVEAALVEGQRRFLGSLVRRLRNVDDAKDVMQDFAVSAIARADDLRDVASVRGWLSRLLASVLMDHHRRSMRRAQREMPGDPWSEDADPAPEPDPDIDGAVCQCIGDVIGLLPPAQADLLRRIDLKDEPRPAVARSLGITDGNLAVRLHRARAKLHDLLVEMCLTCPDHGFFDCGCVRARKRAITSSTPGTGV
jgi:RNA polymerase sigma factor (sigma-70 family)